MTIRLLIIFISSIFIIGCNTSDTESINDNILEKSFNWKSKKEFFKYAKLKSIDFNNLGRPLQSTDNLSEVDNDFKTKHFKHFLDSSWINSTDLFYYGTIEFQRTEQPVFLSIREFDGLSYNYHLINFNSKGEIIKSWVIAYSWEAAECYGYDRFYIESDSMIFETLEKCYDEESAGKQRIDSLRDVLPLTTFKFKK
tara:strand:+ start:45 stop:635 length:591 start_codon:yes stop_codon:yes gene_type:complete